MLKPSVFSLRSWRLGGSIAFVFACSAAFSLTSAATALPFTPRRPYGSHPLQRRHFGGFSRAIRGIKLSIQRFLPRFPPVISADVLRNLQFPP